MDLEAVCTGLADAATAIDGLTCLDYVPDSVTTPCFYTGEVEVDYDKAFARGLDIVTVTCRLLVSRADDRSGQAELKQFMAGSGPRSVKEALEAARGAPGEAALGGACDDLHVQRMQGHRQYTVGDTAYYGAEWVVRVIGSGD